MSTPPAPRTAGPSRLIVVSSNGHCAFPETLIEATAACLSTDRGDHLVVTDQASALTRLLADQGLSEVRVLDPKREPQLDEPRTGVRGRRAFISRAVLEDQFLSRLPIAGSEATNNSVFFWDRLQWLIAPCDPRPFVQALPWESVTEVYIVGGQSQGSALAGLILAEAHTRDLATIGLVAGPVVGRFAPLWALGCDSLFVGSTESALALARAGLTVPAQVTPHLAMGKNAAPMTLPLTAPTRLLLDINIVTLHAPARRALADFAAEHGDHIERFILPVHAPIQERMRQTFGDRIGKVPLEIVEGNAINTAQSLGLPVLSFEPYSILHASKVLRPLEVGVLASCARNAHGVVPRDLEPWLIGTAEESLEGVA